MSMGGGGGGGAPANQNITTSNIAEWARPGVESLIQSGMKTVYPGMTPVYKKDEAGNATNVIESYNLGEAKGYTPFTTTSTDPAMQQAMEAARSTTAGFSPLQQQVFGEAAGMRTPGQFADASTMAAGAGQGGFGSAGQAYGYGGMGAGLGLQAAGLAPQAQTYGATGAGIGGLGMQAGMGYGQQATNPAAVQAYMNPYLQGSLQPQLNEIQRQADLASQAAASQATGAGAFGGTRGQLAQMEAQRAGQLAKQQAIGQGYNQAFQNAQQQMQTAAQLGMQGAGLGMQGQQLGLAGLQQAGQLYGQGMQGAQVGLQGVQGAQAGYGLANQAAQNLSNIGAQQQASDLARLQAQAGFGGTQQQQQQNILNQAMQNYQTMQGYPMQQLAKLESLYTGAPQNITQTGYQAAPSVFSQVAGLGGTALGAYGAMGGFRNGKKGGLPKDFERTKRFDVGGAVIADLKNMDDAHLAEQARTSPSAKVRQEAAQILADRENARGIDQAQSNLPTVYAADGGILNFQPIPTYDGNDGYAGGGMVAFDRGGIAALPVKHYVDTGLVFEDAFGGEPYSKTATRTPTMGTKEVLENLERGKKAEAAAKAAKTVKTAADASKGIALSPWERMVGAGGSKAVGRFLSPLVSAPAAVVSTGGEYLTNAAGNTVKAMSPEMRQMLAEGDVGSDTSLAAAIMNVAGPEKAKEVKEDKKATPAAPSPAAPSPAAPAAKKDDGIDSLIADASGSQGIDAMFGNTPLGRLQAEAYKKVQEADLKQSKAQADLDRQREEIAANKDSKLWQALMMGGAKTMAGTSRHALANIGAGISGGLEDYAKADAAERAEKKLLLQYQTALDQADYAKKMGNFTALEQIQGRLAGLKVAAMNAASTKQASLDAAHQKSFGELVAKLMYQNGLTEEQAIASARKIYASGDKSLPQGATVTRVTPAKS